MIQTDLAKSKKYALVAIVIVILILGLLITFTLFPILKGNNTSQNSQKSQKFQDLQSQQLSPKLPYTTIDFGIVYSKDKKTLYVNVFKPPYEENRRKALKWLQDNGFDPGKLNIVYAPRSTFK